MSALVWFFTCLDSFMSNLGLCEKRRNFFLCEKIFSWVKLVSKSCILQPCQTLHIFIESSVCALKCFQMAKTLFALFTGIWSLSCMCSSMLPSHWIRFCIVHRDLVSLLYVFFNASKSLNSFLQCSQGYVLSPECALKCFQMAKILFALFTGIWFLSCMCSSRLPSH